MVPCRTLCASEPRVRAREAASSFTTASRAARRSADLIMARARLIAAIGSTCSALRTCTTSSGTNSNTQSSVSRPLIMRRRYRSISRRAATLLVVFFGVTTARPVDWAGLVLAPEVAWAGVPVTGRVVDGVLAGVAAGLAVGFAGVVAGLAGEPGFVGAGAGPWVATPA